MKPSLFFAKILLYDGHYPDRVIYLRTHMTIDQVIKWRWYFEYLQALVKVRHPRRKVELTIGPSDTKLGQEWKEFHTANLLRHRKAKLKKLMNEKVQDDLFHFHSEERAESIRKVKMEIAQLEQGIYPIVEFPDYVNLIKQYI